MLKIGNKYYRNIQEQVQKNMEDIEGIKKTIPYPSDEYYNKDESDEKFETKEEAFSGSYNDLSDKPIQYVYSLEFRCKDDEAGYQYYPIFTTIPTTENLGDISDTVTYSNAISLVMDFQTGFDNYNEIMCAVVVKTENTLGLKRYDGAGDEYDINADSSKIIVKIKDKKTI